MQSGIPVNVFENRALTQLIRLLGVLAIAAGALLAAFMPGGVPLGAMVAAGSAMVLAGNELYAARQRAARRWLIDSGSGFGLVGGPTVTEVHDCEVTSVRFMRTPRPVAGAITRARHCFEVWTVTSGRPIRVTYFADSDDADPLAALVKRVTKSLKQRAADSMARGGTLEGDGWQIVGAQLAVQHGGKMEFVPVVEIDKTAVFGGRRCLWRRGEVRPFLKVNRNSKNARVLAMLLKDYLGGQRDESSGQGELVPEVSGLGRLLFERRGVGAFARYGVLIIHVAAMAWVSRHHLMITLVLGSSLGLFEKVFASYRFCFHELGISRRWLRREVSLKYDDITEFTYVVVQPKNFQLSTRVAAVSATFRAARATICYSNWVSQSDADMSWLRDHVAGILGVKMLEKVRGGLAAPWMADMVLLPTGLQFRRPGKFGSRAGPAKILPYADIESVTIKDHVLRVFVRSDAKPLISKPDSAANLFPGYLALLALMQLAACQHATRSSGAATECELDSARLYPLVGQIMAQDDANDPALESYQKYKR